MIPSKLGSIFMALIAGVVVAMSVRAPVVGFSSLVVLLGLFIYRRREPRGVGDGTLEIGGAVIGLFTARAAMFR
jgi:hypothetical protein